MIRFVDLSEDYWTDPEIGHPVCAFLRTNNDKFLKTDMGDHTFSDMEDINSHPEAERLLGLMPDGFFEGVKVEVKGHKYRFYWLDGTTNEGEGRDVADAFTRLGYGAGAIRALDYHKEIS